MGMCASKSNQSEEENKNENDTDVLSRAILKGDAATVRRLLDQGVQPKDDDVEEAAMAEFPEVTKVLIEDGYIDVNEDWEHAGDLLINMVCENKIDFVRWLLDHDANPNSGCLISDSASAMCAAAQRGSIPLATILLNNTNQHGPAPVSGEGALSEAAGRGQLEMVQFLLDHGANIDEVGVHDYGDRRRIPEEGTALHKAAERGDLEMAKVLSDRGAGLEILDKLGKTPLIRARDKGQEDMVRFLRERGAKDE